MANAGTVTVDFAAETSKFTAEMKKVNDRLKSMESDFNAFGGVVKKVGGIFGGLISAQAFVSFARQAFVTADAMANAAARAGIAASEFSRLKFAAEASNASSAALETGMRQLQKTLSDATSGSASAERAFSRLGLSASNLTGLRLNEQLGVIADQFKRVVDPADQTRIAMEIFGRSGTELIPLLRKGSSGLQELREEADRLGITMRDSAAAGVAALDDALKRLRASTLGAATNVLGETALRIIGPDFDNAISVATYNILQLKAARDSLVTAGAAHGIFDVQAIENYNRQIAEAEGRLRAIQAYQDGSAQIKGPLSRNPLVPILDNPQDAAAAARAQAEAERLREQEAARNAQLDKELAWQRRMAEIRRAADEEERAQKLLKRQWENQVNTERIEQLIQQEVTLSNEIIRVQSDGAAFLAQIRQNLGLQEITFEQIKNASLVDIATTAFSGLAGVSKKFAKIQQGIAAGEVVIATAKNIARAFPNFGLMAMAAAVGATQLATIKAVAFDNPSASISRGGVGGGSVSAVESPQSQATVAEGAQSRGHVTIAINGGNFAGPGSMQWLIDSIRDELDRDVTVFGASSRQAIDLQPA